MLWMPWLVERWVSIEPRLSLGFRVLLSKIRVPGRVLHGTDIGPKLYLCYADEKELVEFLVTCLKMGYGKTRQEVLKLVETVLLKKGTKVKSLSQGCGFAFTKDGPN